MPNASLTIDGTEVIKKENGVVSLKNTNADTSLSFPANHAGIKTALNASGDAPISACRAWVNFSDEDTTIRASFNVSSVTDNSNYNTVNFLTAMPDTNYCIVGAGGDSGTDSGCWFTTGYNVNSINTVNTTTSFRIEMYYTSGATAPNNAFIYAAVFR